MGAQGLLWASQGIASPGAGIRAAPWHGSTCPSWLLNAACTPAANPQLQSRIWPLIHGVFPFSLPFSCPETERKREKPQRSKASHERIPSSQPPGAKGTFRKHHLKPSKPILPSAVPRVEGGFIGTSGTTPAFPSVSLPWGALPIGCVSNPEVMLERIQRELHSLPGLKPLQIPIE